MNNATEDMTEGNQHETALSLRLKRIKIKPTSDAQQPETLSVGADGDNEHQNQGVTRVKKLISRMSIPHAIDFLAFWSFIFIFVWFNFDQILPLLD